MTVAWSDEEISVIAELRRAGRSFVWIAEKLDRAESAVSHLCYKLRLPVEVPQGELMARRRREREAAIEIVDRECCACGKGFKARGRYLRMCPGCRERV